MRKYSNSRSWLVYRLGPIHRTVAQRCTRYIYKDSGFINKSRKTPIESLLHHYSHYSCDYIQIGNLFNLTIYIKHGSSPPDMLQGMLPR